MVIGLAAARDGSGERNERGYGGEDSGRCGSRPSWQ
jgi:hypothetical protein